MSPDGDEGWEERAAEVLGGECVICGEQIPVAEALAHLRDVHGATVDLARWPDGEPVIYDDTLTPEDFA